MAISLEQQQQQLYKLEAELANLKKEEALLRQQSKGGLLKKPDLTSVAGKKIATDLANKVNEVKAKQKEYNALNKIFNEAKKESEIVSEVGSADEIRKAAEAGFGPNQILEYRADIQKQLDAKKLQEQAKNQNKIDEVNSQELSNELATAGKTIAKGLDEQGRIDLATQLNKVYNLNLPLNGKYSKELKAAYTQMLADKFERSLDEGRTISVGEFLELGTKEGTYRKTDTGNVPTINVSDRTEAAAYVRSVFKSVLQRDPTAEEITKFSNILNNAEKKSPKKTVNGVTTGGLGSPIEFLTQEVQKLPEFATKKKEKDILTSQSLQSIARANGISLSADQLDSYANDVRNGKDINVIKNDIRNIASYGMPDNIKKMLANGTDLETIYAPYKQTMAAVLELNPTDITLDDSVLRSAIGPDKELPLYEFKKMLKKDSRWQYTNNARAEVSDKVLRVLRDFGFQG